MIEKNLVEKSIPTRTILPNHDFRVLVKLSYNFILSLLPCINDFFFFFRILVKKAPVKLLVTNKKYSIVNSFFLSVTFIKILRILSYK